MIDFGKDLQRAYDEGYAQAVIDIKVAHVPKTNAERIRVMTDEELARLFQGYVDCLYCPQRLNEKCMDDDGSCFLAWLSWLRQEDK